MFKLNLNNIDLCSISYAVIVLGHSGKTRSKIHEGDCSINKLFNNPKNWQPSVAQEQFQEQ